MIAVAIMRKWYSISRSAQHIDLKLENVPIVTVDSHLFEVSREIEKWFE